MRPFAGAPLLKVVLNLISKTSLISDTIFNKSLIIILFLCLSCKLKYPKVNFIYSIKKYLVHFANFPLHQRNVIIHSVCKFIADEMPFQYFRQHLFHLVSCQARQGYFRTVNPHIFLADFVLSCVQSDQACFSRITFGPHGLMSFVATKVYLYLY